MREHVFPGDGGGHMPPGPRIRASTNVPLHDLPEVVPESIRINKGAVLDPEKPKHKMISLRMIENWLEHHAP